MKRSKTKYGKKATEKVARTMHEFKRGKLRSGGGGKVTSRAQAIAIGLSQARRAGYKAPPRGHATVSLDVRTREYLRNMRPGTEIDARGLARALGRVDPLEADYALERAEKAGLAVSRDGRWFGPAGGQLGHAKKSAKQIESEIAEALEQSAVSEPSTITLRDRYSGNPVLLTVRDGRIVSVMGSDPWRYMGMSLEEAKHYARHGGRGREKKTSPAHAVRKARAPRVALYRIQLTPDELRALEYARGRYAWPDVLLAYAADDGSIALTESEMWQWVDDVDSDDSPFSLASPAFAAKLQRFYDSRV